METHTPTLQVALVILRVGDRFALQLRDQRPDILAPGVWALFGGTIEAGETPAQAVLREVEEELTIRPDQCELLWYVDRYSDFHEQTVRHWIFDADVTSFWPQHDLREGQSVRLFTWEEHAQMPVYPFVVEIMTSYHARPLNMLAGDVFAGRGHRL